MAAANGEPAPCPRCAVAHARCDGESDTTIKSSEIEYDAASPASAKSPCSASRAPLACPGCTRAITIGTGSLVATTLTQNTISSPSSGLTDWMRSAICRNSCPVSEFHQAPNVAFWVDCSWARARARLIVRPGFGTAP